MPLLPDWSAIKAGNKADRRKRTIQRNLRGKKLSTSYISHTAPKKAAKRVAKSLAHPIGTIINRSKLEHAPRTANRTTVSATRGAPQAGYNLVAINNAKASSAKSFNGGYSKAYKTPDEALRGTPRTAKLIQKSARALPLTSTNPPMPRQTVTKSSSGTHVQLGARIKAAFAANKGNNEALAKKRMIAAGKRG